MNYRVEIENHYIAKYPHLHQQTIREIFEYLIDRMEEGDMPEQEIISILLPLDHPLNATPDARRS